MKSKKSFQQAQKNKAINELGDHIRKGKLPTDKVKYKHKNFWLEQEDDDDYELPKHEEE